MPLPFNPARATALARGLRIVEGEPGALARARALRRSMTTREQPQFRSVDTGKTYAGVTPEVEAAAADANARGAGVRFGAKATAEQQMVREAARRHFEALGEQEDPRQWFASPEEPPKLTGGLNPQGNEDVARAQARQLSALRRAKQIHGLDDAQLLGAFERRYGWQPATWGEVESLLPLNEYAALIRALTEGGR